MSQPFFSTTDDLPPTERIIQIMYEDPLLSPETTKLLGLGSDGIVYWFNGTQWSYYSV